MNRWPGWALKGRRSLGDLLDKLRHEAPILLVEHDMDAVFRLADRITVLSYGRVLATGSVDEVRARPRSAGGLSGGPGVSLLEVRGITATYGHVQALFGVDLTVEAGEVVALMGRNGMGKTTTIRCITRMMRPGGGTLMFDGRDLKALKSQQRRPVGRRSGARGAAVLCQPDRGREPDRRGAAGALATV